LRYCHCASVYQISSL